MSEYYHKVYTFYLLSYEQPISGFQPDEKEDASKLRAHLERFTSLSFSTCSSLSMPLFRGRAEMPNLGPKRGVIFSFLCHVLLLPNSLLPRALAPAALQKPLASAILTGARRWVTIYLNRKEEAMPKVVPAALIWIPEQQIYLVSEQGSAHRYPLPEDQEQRRAWLAACSTFSFQGQSGRLTLRKEARQRGEDHYWYAYHRQGSRLVKRYAGRTVDLTLERLETIALALSTTSRSRVLPAQRTESVPTRSASVAQIREDHQEPLLVPKLSLPQPHPSLIARARLLARLDAALEHRLTVLAAPAGFGKTTLVSQWVAHLQTLRPLLPVAWVSLEAEENDPLRFWRYVITACQVFQADLGAAALGLLPIHSTPRQFSQEAVLTALLNDLATLSRPAVLVLEDYHAINNAQIYEALTAFVDHLPPALHLVLITRQEPPLPLARLRGQNALVELHADDLRFSLEETYTFFQRTTSFQLTAATIERVARRTEGWIAGLHLLAFALHRQELSSKRSAS